MICVQRSTKTKQKQFWMLVMLFSVHSKQEQQWKSLHKLRNTSHYCIHTGAFKQLCPVVQPTKLSNYWCIKDETDCSACYQSTIQTQVLSQCALMHHTLIFQSTSCLFQQDNAKPCMLFQKHGSLRAKQACKLNEKHGKRMLQTADVSEQLKALISPERETMSLHKPPQLTLNSNCAVRWSDAAQLHCHWHLMQKPSDFSMLKGWSTGLKRFAAHFMFTFHPALLTAVVQNWPPLKNSIIIQVILTWKVFKMHRITNQVVPISLSQWSCSALLQVVTVTECVQKSLQLLSARDVSLKKLWFSPLYGHRHWAHLSTPEQTDPSSFCLYPWT